MTLQSKLEQTKKFTGICSTNMEQGYSQKH